jgi:vacuolar-type H+-ATPase subunit E/Vma4
VTGADDGGLGALEPVGQALLASAREQAERIGADAADEGRRILQAARAQAAGLLAAAREQGEAEAAALAALERSRSRGAARTVVLAAQRAAFEELRERARAEVRALLADPEQHQRLVAVVTGRLGGQATVHDRLGGGVVAETADGRLVDAGVDALVDRAMAGLDLGDLWAPG